MTLSAATRQNKCSLRFQHVPNEMKRNVGKAGQHHERQLLTLLKHLVLPVAVSTSSVSRGHEFMTDSWSGDGTIPN